MLLGAANGFDREHLNQQSTIVEHRADLLARAGALPFVVYVLQNGFLHLAQAGSVLDRQRAVAFRALADVLHVRFRARPPDAQHPIARERRRLGLLERRRIHHAPAPQQHVVGALLANLQPHRFLFDSRRSHRDLDQFEAMQLGVLLEQRDRLLAER